jgi:hypothetical protein
MSMSVNPIKVVLIGSETTLIKSLTQFFADTEGYDIIGSFKTLEEAKDISDDSSVHFVFCHHQKYIKQFFKTNHPTLNIPLTHREKEIIELLSKGMLYKEKVCSIKKLRKR